MELAPRRAVEKFELRRACALLLGCAFIGGRLWERKQAQTTARISSQQKQQQAVHAQQPERVVVVVLSDHLERSERLLVELKHADAGSIEMASPLRDQARNMLAANRICRQNAGDMTILSWPTHLIAWIICWKSWQTNPAV